MIDLKRKKEKKGTSSKAEAVPSSSYDERPYCLRFTLEKPELAKLGVKAEDFRAGASGKITATVEVFQVTAIDSKTTDEWNENSNHAVTFQIMGIDLGELKGPGKGMSAAVHDLKKKGPGE